MARQAPSEGCHGRQSFDVIARSLFTGGHLVVVAAVVLRDNKVLLARRVRGSLAGHWEFPGGKVEPGETHAQALARELQEELGAQAAVGSLFGQTEAANGSTAITLYFYLCSLQSEPRPGADHDALVWVSLADLGQYELAPADLPIARRLGEFSNENKNGL